MLLEKLEAASDETRRRRRLFVLALSGVAVLLTLFLLGVVRIDVARLGLLPDDGPAIAKRSAPEPSRSEPSPSGPPVVGFRPSSPTGTRGPPVSSGELGSVPAPVAPQAPPDSAPASPAPNPATPSAENPAARLAFKEALAVFERKVEPAVADTDFAAWDRAFQSRLPSRKAAAVDRFADGDYAGAVAALGILAKEARTALAARDAAFDGALAAARNAANADDYDGAARAIADALRLRGADTEAQALKVRIDALPQILDLVRRAGIARTENNLAGEATLIAEAIAVDASRTDLVERLAAIRADLTERKFASHIASGMDAVERRDVAVARRAHAAARAIFAERSETKLLAGRVVALAREIEIARLSRRAETAAANDDWLTAQTHYEALAKMLPGDARVQSGLDLAQRVNSLSGRIAAHLAAPGRLASDNVAGEATALIAASRVPAAMSAQLARQRNALVKAIAAYTAKVSVAVVSDGTTHISVRGVGQVGVTTGRTVELRPGRYTFEGSRAGYRSKLLTVDIPPGATGVTVEIVCDEPV